MTSSRATRRRPSACLSRGTPVNMALLSRPAWMWVAGPVVILGGGWLGSRLAARPPPVVVV